jgi:hypothetical protein
MGEKLVGYTLRSWVLAVLEVVEFCWFLAFDIARTKVVPIEKKADLLPFQASFHEVITER